jgi:hypothetical protein
VDTENREIIINIITIDSRCSFIKKRTLMHPTYIGQIEREEKNIIIESLEKVTNALGFSMKELFKSIQPDIQQNKYSYEMNEIINLVKGGLGRNKDKFNAITVID